MLKLYNSGIELKRLTNPPGHSFFGYYDLQPWDLTGRYHLCHKVNFWERLPEKNDVAELGMIGSHDLSFIPLAKTSAWNFQQGAMLQWNPSNPTDEIIFNARFGEHYRGVIKNIHTGSERLLDRPVANVDAFGRYALSINFDRMFDFRQGYGYAGVRDKHYNENHPDDDGIFLIDLNTGKSKLILSLNTIWELMKSRFEIDGDNKILINHITFNNDGTRFIFLTRYFSDGISWETSIGTANTDGSDVFFLSGFTYASHYCWRDPQHILIHTKHNDRRHLCLMKDKTDNVEIMDDEFFKRDGHCSYSSDRQWILYDSYPIEGYRELYLYSVKQRKGITLASFFSDPKAFRDIRCDLHPRFNRDGTLITLDSTHEGGRHIYCMDISNLI
ncbi:MAG: hypothetical protein BWY15_00917 [Firmicutes bacterium ADurb.Bin193]|nr:MAG: hypothetical protein BWY15_00917 [Firmicutes bacterium ADurb.Bin193]